MSLPVVWRGAAQREYGEAFDWYEAQNPGLGVRFAAEVRQALQRIRDMPLMYRRVRKDVRRGPVNGFPYGVFYRPHADRIEVIAVFHARRNPAVWQARI